MVYNSHSSKRRKETALKRGKRQRISNGASPVTTCDDESNSTGELANANQISVGVGVDADHLGPCEPGTDVVLEGIVWAETNRGVLVVNVTWKGRTYVGTLLDSSSGNFNMYRSIAPFFEDAPADKGVREASKRTNVEVATTCTDANGSHCDACDLSQPSSTPMCFRQLCACVTQCKSPLQHESSNAIQRLEYMTSNRINALQTQSTQAKSCDNLACAQVEQSPINALSSLIEDTSKSFEIHNRHQNRCGGQKSASWPMDHNNGEWKQRRRDTIRTGDPPFSALDQRARHATSDCTRSNVIIGELCEAVGMPFAANNSANRAPKSH